MATFAVFTRAEAKTMQKLVLWLLELPTKGVHIGGGVHVAEPDVAPNPCPLNLAGWTTRGMSWVAYPGNTGASTDQFALRVTQQLQDAWAAKKSQLTLAQRTWVQNHLASAADLAADWLVNGTVQESADVDPDP